jgi:tetratricopeptide (TPR) repeat protein
VTSGDFVGRERERETLSARLAAALDGAGQVVLVAGEPGAGKTRLVKEIVEHAGIGTAWGRATDDEGSPPYWPFRQIIRTLGAQVPEAGPEAQERFRLFEEITEILIDAAEPGGLVIVLDDLQWADPASTRLLVHLARGLQRSRLAVLATYRDTEAGGPLRSALAELAREPVVNRIRLTGLTADEVGAQLGGITGWAVPESVAAAVCRRTQGNPFFVGELGRLLADGRDGELPDGVRDAVRGRLARLSASCRSVVSAAAVLGSTPDPAALAAATGRGLAEVLAALDEAAAAQLIAGRFSHDLIREAARLEVPTAERLALHQRMAEYLAERPDAEVAEVAFHWLESLPAGDARQAVTWAERAAEQAMTQLAWEEADALYARALSAAAHRPDRCRLLLGRARAQVRAYDVDGSRQSLLAAAELARAAGDAETLAQASLVMEGVSDFVWDAQGRALCEEALAALPDADSPVRARLLAQRVVADSWQVDNPAEPLSEAALAMAERVGDRRAIVEALRARQLAFSGPDGARDRVELGDRLLAIGGDDDTMLWGHLWRFDAFAQLGELNRAESECDALDTAAARLRSPLARWHALRSRAAIALVRGRFADAERLGQEGLALAQRAGHDGALLPSIGFLLILRGLTGNAAAISDEVVDSYGPQMPFLRGVLASWMLVMDRRDEAERLYRTMPPPEQVPGFVFLSGLGAVADLAAEFDDREGAERIYRLLSPFADRWVCGGAGVVAILGSVRLALGIAAATSGRLDDAVRQLRAAIEIHERAGAPPYTALSRYHLATVLARRKRPGDREEAAALTASAAAQARELGMDRLLAKATEPVSGPLTKREREIAALVSQGCPTGRSPPPRSSASGPWRRTSSTSSASSGSPRVRRSPRGWSRRRSVPGVRSSTDVRSAVGQDAVRHDHCDRTSPADRAARGLALRRDQRHADAQPGRRARRRHDHRGRPGT